MPALREDQLRRLDNRSGYKRSTDTRIRREVVGQPERVSVSEILIRPTQQAN